MKTSVKALAALIAAVIALACISTAQALPPQRMRLEYQVKYSGRLDVEAAVVTELAHDGKRYSLVEESRGTGLAAALMPGVLRRSAKGAISPDGLRPEEFHDRRGNRPENQARFDWANGVLVYSTEGRTETQAMPERESLNDRLSFLWTFAFRAAPALNVLRTGSEIAATLTDGRGLSTFRYRVAGLETLATRTGALKTVKLVKQRDAGDDRATEIWLAIERDYLPVRILVIEKDGTRADQVLTSFGA